MSQQKKPRMAGLGKMRIKTVDLYVARLFLGAYIACFIIFSGFFVAIEFSFKFDRFMREEGNILSTLLKYNLAMIPTVFTNFMGPILTSAAGLFTVTLLNRNNEIQALKTNGMSVYRLLLPVFIISFLLIGLTFYLQEVVLPGNRESIRTALAISRSRLLEPEAYYDSRHGLRIEVGQYSTTAQIGRMVKILERHPNAKARRHINANQMKWVQTGPPESEEGFWTLYDGSIQKWDNEGDLMLNEDGRNFQRLKKVFAKMKLETTLQPIDLEASNREISYLSWKQLQSQFKRQDYHRHLAVKLHHHFAFPLAHILLLFLGLPFVLKMENRSIFLGLVASFLIGAAFYLVTSVCASIAIDGNYFSPTLAAWFPIMLFGALGLTLFDQIPT